jgi:hypothetical protein
MDDGLGRDHAGATDRPDVRDDLVPHPAWQFTRAITINAPAVEVWRWLVQLGKDRAGYYSYDWLENMTGADIHDGNTIRP